MTKPEPGPVLVERTPKRWKALQLGAGAAAAFALVVSMATMNPWAFAAMFLALGLLGYAKLRAWWETG